MLHAHTPYNESVYMAYDASETENIYYKYSTYADRIARICSIHPVDAKLLTASAVVGAMCDRLNEPHKRQYTKNQLVVYTESWFSM